MKKKDESASLSFTQTQLTKFRFIAILR